MGSLPPAELASITPVPPERIVTAPDPAAPEFVNDPVVPPSADADIDALMNSVVGRSGEIVEFPTTVETRARVKANRAVDKVASLSSDLADELAANEKERVVIDPRTVPARFSRLKHFSASPLHYWQAVQDDKDDTIAMRFGRGVHALVLGTPVIRFPGKTRQGKMWEAFKERHADKEILSGKEWDRANGMVDAIRRHSLANEALFAGTTLEETIEWEFNGKACTSRPDARCGTDRNVDLKTTKCAEPRKFERDAMWRGYHAQFSYYGRAIKECFGAFPKESLCVAVESVKPFAITVLELTPGALVEGEKCWRLWFERVQQCEARFTSRISSASRMSGSPRTATDPSF